MNKVSDEIIERLRQCKNLPSLPKAAMDIIEVAQQPEIDMGMVADAVGKDPAIAAKVMRIANSVLYARRQKSSNLRQALITLGLNATLTLALSFTLVNKLRKDPTKGFDFNQFWKRSIVAASWSRMLANELDMVGAEEVFLVSLLQDIGMLAIDRVAPDVYENVNPFDMPHSDLAAIEVRRMAADHSEVGAWLLAEWNMPQVLVHAVQHSHDPFAAEVDNKTKTIVQVTALSSLLADSCCCPKGTRAMAKTSQLVSRTLGISPERLSELYDMLLEQIPEAESVFELSLMNEAEIQSIIESAHETLLLRNLNVVSQAAELVERAESLQSENQALRKASRIDELTGVYNRRHFEDALQEEYDFAVKHGAALSLIFVDIDYFKQANDVHGHLAGDMVLKSIALLLLENVRQTDTVARFGGDEFVVVLPGTDVAHTAHIAGRIVAGARHLQVTDDQGRSVGVTLSLGTATQSIDNNFSSAAGLLRAADTALYDSKRKGRDCHTAYDKVAVA